MELACLPLWTEGAKVWQWRRTLDGPLEGGEGCLDRVAAVAGGVPGVAVRVDVLGAGLGQEGALNFMLANGLGLGGFV